jgi:carnitine O-acetyltransferase
MEPTKKAALDALKCSSTGFDLSIPAVAIPGVHPVIAGQPLHQYQQNLPPLPIPPLQSTLQKYIQCLQPLLAHDPVALERAVNAVKSFEQNEGPQLHEALLNLAKETGKEHEWPHSHWLEKIWDELAYLSDRVPLPMSVNCMGTLFECTGTSYPTWRAGAVIHGLMRFDQSVRDGTLNPESLDARGKIPLCMYQYERLFRHTRVPLEPGMDRWVSYKDSRHIAVIANSRWYTFDVVRVDGTLLTTSECVRELDIIRRMAQEDDRNNVPAPNIVSMTCGTRGTWQSQRSSLKDSTSTAGTTLEHIESAVFHVCLSSSTPSNEVELMNLGCTGHGRDVWMDKSFTMIVTANGKMVFNMEHSHADAPMHSRMIEFMKQIVTKEAVNELSQDGVANASYTSTVMPLRWGNLTTHVNESLIKSKQFADALLSTHRLALLKFQSFGKKLLKKLKTSPDSFVQMALQLSFYRNQNRFTSTYETGTTRAFYHGRTETIRSLTTESWNLCLAMCDGSSSSGNFSMSDKYQLLRNALASHGQYLKNSCQGQAIDRHMLGMRVMAMKMGIEMPNIFTDSSYPLMNKFELSTSSMAVTHYNDYLGFGAPAPDSYGCCYCMTGDQLLMVISANAACPEKDVNQFHDCIVQALLDLEQVLQHGIGSKV